MNNQPPACGSCGLTIDEPTGFPVADRTPCPQCGSTARKYFILSKATAKAQPGLGFKQKRPDVKKPLVEGFTGRDLRKRDGDFIQKERLIDRENDKYREKIVTDSGDIIRNVDEPLSKHRGRGSAKFKQS